MDLHAREKFQKEMIRASGERRSQTMRIAEPKDVIKRAEARSSNEDVTHHFFWFMYILVSTQARYLKWYIMQTDLKYECNVKHEDFVNIKY